MKFKFNVRYVLEGLILVFAVTTVIFGCMTLREVDRVQAALENSPATCSMFDTSALESWCGDGSDGTIRMVSGWKYADGVDGNIIVKDEAGTLWEIENISTISTDDFLLLWIVDNNTPEDVTDDSVIKTWSEAWG